MGKHGSGKGKQDPEELVHKRNLKAPQGHVRQLMSICVGATFSTLASLPFAVLPTSQVPEEEGCKVLIRVVSSAASKKIINTLRLIQ